VTPPFFFFSSGNVPHRRVQSLFAPFSPPLQEERHKASFFSFLSGNGPPLLFSLFRRDFGCDPFPFFSIRGGIVWTPLTLGTGITWPRLSFFSSREGSPFLPVGEEESAVSPLLLSPRTPIGGPLFFFFSQ